MSFETLLATIGDAEILLPLIGSLIAGALIGAEREVNGKPAGLRTHTLVCFSSSLMTLVALLMDDWSADLPEGTQIVSDMSRMPHAILTGIGFLGAGVIFREGASVHGLTTAASLWLTAALGITFGTGLLELGVIGTTIALLVLMLLRIAQGLAPLRPQFRLEVMVSADSPLDANRLQALLARQGLRAGPLSLQQDRVSGYRHYKLFVAVRDRQFDAEALAQRIGQEPAVTEIAIIPMEIRPVPAPSRAD